MRITGGKLGGRLVRCPEGIIRPAMDKMRESIFAIIQEELPGASFLDLFSGSGVIGLEAWSRGAQKIVMVEKDRGKRHILAENAALAEGNAVVHIMPVERYLKFMTEGPFNFIFLDPPFPYRFKAQLLDMAGEPQLLAEGGSVLIHHPKEDKLPEKTTALLQTDRRVYGRSVVRFYKRA
ncbi:MAG: 16S rRNA (guanine(966)-N(2))-methyltransferase RsmD [Spirochaetales bacterium]|jgi:16S rRNA (guanine(966)-N(2))-methyltransferase RsmD|nr:16S rRNA (guanine(966)-N(2))-methyltransferase RsmD [Spirochaetales bacterium]